MDKELNGISERTVLGTMLVRPEHIDELADTLQGADFTSPHYEHVFDAIYRVHISRKPVTVTSVSEELAKVGVSVQVGGVAGLADLMRHATGVSQAAYEAERVKADSVKRDIWRTGARLQTVAVDAKSDQVTAVDAVNTARKELDALIIDDQKHVPHSIAVRQAFDVLGEPESVGQRTPWRALDHKLCGWKPGGLYVAGARPAVGKTVFVVQAAVDAARKGKRAGAQSVIFSLEMTKVELYHRMLSAAGGVDMGHIQSRNFEAGEMEELDRAAAGLADLPLVVHDDSGMTVAGMTARVRRAQRDGSVGMVVVDYLQLVRPAKGSGSDRRVQVDGIARDLKNMAKDFGVPVVVATQLNRAVTSRASGEPVLADLRESGEIEQAADVVMLLHRSEDVSEEFNVNVAKNRHGATGGVVLAAQFRFARVVEMGGGWDQRV